MSIPAKIQRGANVKEATFNKINQILDYLKTQRLTGDLKTIKITQNTSGISISALPQNATAKGGKSESLDYPFKMSIVTEEQKNFLSIKDGRIQINDNFQDRCYIENFKIELNQLKNDGEYAVILLLSFNPLYDGDSVNPIFTPYIYFTNSGSLTSNIPQTRGIFTIPLGTIKRETIEDKTNFSVENAIIGNFVIDYLAIRHPFSISAKVKNLTTGTLKNEWSLSDFSYFVDKGTVKIENTLINTAEKTFNISSDTNIYCKINETEKTAQIISGNNQPFYTPENSVYCYQIGAIMNNSGVYIEQYINSLIYGNSDTYKIKVNNEDKPDFIQNKIVANSEGFPVNGYIGLEYPLTVQTGNYRIKPYWMYNLISGFSDSEQKILKIENGVPAWKEEDKTEVATSGSLANHVQIKEIEENKFVRWKAEYQISDGQGHFVFQDQSGKLTLWNGGNNQAAESVLIWDHSNMMPSVSTPPEATEKNPVYFLQGSKETGIFWGTHEECGDSFKVKVNKDDNFEGFLQDKIVSEFNSILINSFDVPNPENESETGHILTLDINPETFISSDKSVNIEVTEENQIDFKSNNAYKVKLNEQDEIPDYLLNKIQVEQPLSMEVSEGKIKIKLNIPEGNGVLAMVDGQLTLIEFGDCKKNEQ